MTTPPAARDPSRSRESVPSASRMNLSNRMVIVWNRGKTKITHLLRIVLPRTRAVQNWTCHFPPELTEMIITHLIGDLHALKAFSLTCREWYIAAVPHLHHTLTLKDTMRDKTHEKLKPVSELDGLGLAPLVKEIRVTEPYDTTGHWFEPQAFSRHDLRHFSAFTNVQALTLQGVDISSFMPDIDRYFGYLSPTLRSIALVEPRCTPRQLSSFLSLFSNLDDIYISSPVRETTKIVHDSELVLFSSPKLRGRLKLFDFTWVETLTDLITLCGGLRFRDMDLCKAASCAPIMLEACVGTLETLRFHMAACSPRSLLPEFDLSRLKALRSLQIGFWAAKPFPPDRHAIVMEVFLTITSPVFSELVIVLELDDIMDIRSDVAFFETLDRMNEVRPFTLVFLAKLEESFCRRTAIHKRLENVISFVTARGLLSSLNSRPVARITGLPEWEIWPSGFI